MKAAVILNSKAGTVQSATGEPLSDRIERDLRQYGVDSRIHLARADEVAHLAAELADSDVQTIIAGGGDGTLNTVASALIGRDRIMGVLPLGTFNHFAHDLGVAELESALRVIGSGHVKRIDIGQVNGHNFLNFSSVGIYPHAVVQREQQKERWGLSKGLAMAAALTNQWVHHKPTPMRLTVGDQETPVVTPFLFVGINAYVTQRVSQAPPPAEGSMLLAIGHELSRLAILQLAARASLGLLKPHEDFEARYVQQLRIDADRTALLVAVDGEVRSMAPPLEYRVLPGALQVFAPHESPRAAATEREAA